MSISDIIQQRGITEILHFTTNNGLVGILRQRLLKARAFLKEDESLVYILKLNTETEYDPEWKEYVNLSISRINPRLFRYSTRVNVGFKWRILSFSPSILSHPEVLFTTTNNAYRWHLKRGAGAEGLEALFAPRVNGVYGDPIDRIEGMAANLTTCVQAEVLYPREVSIEHLQRIYVRTDEEADSVHGKLATLNAPKVPVVVSPRHFQ